MEDYISTDPRVCAGRPHIAGTRITVELVQDYVSTGYTAEQIQKEYSHLSLEQIRAAMHYICDDVSLGAASATG